MASSASLDELQKKFDGNQRRYLAPLANELRKTGDLEGAIELCRAHLPDYPEHLSGYVVFGQALYEAGQLDEASSAFSTALTLDPENLIALRHLGDIARDRGDREGAREWYERVLDADPRNETIASALQSLESMSNAPAPARPTPATSSTPLSSTPVSSSAFEAPSLDYGILSSSQPSLPTPPSVNAYHPPLAEPVASAGVNEAADDTVDFDPGFFSAGTEQTESILDAPQSEEERNDIEALAIDGAHEVDPSELALAAALDAPIIDEPVAPAFDGDAAFDFQATALDDSFAIDHGSADEPTSTDARGDDGSSSSTETMPEPLELDNGYDASSRATPAYGSGFDASTFIADAPEEVPPPAVTPPADLGLDPMEFVAPERSSVGTPTSSEPFVTETMAELYLQQGFRNEALEVYEQLAAAAPDDSALHDRVEELRQPPAAEGQGSGAHGAISEAAPDVAAAPPAPAAPSSAPTARDFFAALARRTGESGHEPDPPNGADGPAGSDVATESSGDRSTDSSVAHASNGGGDSLAALFGHEAADADDERAASALAELLGDGSLHGETAIVGANTGEHATIDAEANPAPTARGGTPAATPSVTSAPTRPAARELSLDDVFGAPRPAARSTPNSSFSFDQFFAEAQTSAPAEPAPDAPAAEDAPPADEASDLAQFNAWLEGLKKR